MLWRCCTSGHLQTRARPAGCHREKLGASRASRLLWLRDATDIELQGAEIVQKMTREVEVENETLGIFGTRERVICLNGSFQ